MFNKYTSYGLNTKPRNYRLIATVRIKLTKFKLILFQLKLIFKKSIPYGSNKKPLSYHLITTVGTNFTTAKVMVQYSFTSMFKLSI